MIGLEGGEQLGAERAVDHAMIDRERHAHHGGDLQRVVLDHGALLGAADRQDARLAAD